MCVTEVNQNFITAVHSVQINHKLQIFGVDKK